jgi:hypothetical protein
VTLRKIFEVKNLKLFQDIIQPTPALLWNPKVY